MRERRDPLQKVKIVIDSTDESGSDEEISEEIEHHPNSDNSNKRYSLEELIADETLFKSLIDHKKKICRTSLMKGGVKIHDQDLLKEGEVWMLKMLTQTISQEV